MAVDSKEYFVLDKADMVHALSLIMPYGAYLAPLLKQVPVEHLNKVYEANMQHAKEYNHMEDRMREAQNEAAILRRRLASYERKSQPTSGRHKNTSKT
jgi:hypothetical protein